MDHHTDFGAMLNPIGSMSLTNIAKDVTLIPDSIKNWNQKPEQKEQYYVMGIKKGNKPSKIHQTYESAKAEAERLAIIEGDDFVVLKVMLKVKRSEDLIWEVYSY